MFVANNTFAIDAVDLKLEPHPGHWVFTSKNLDQVYIDFTGTFSRSNLMVWLKRFFENPSTFRFKAEDSAQGRDDTIFGAFDLVDNAITSGLPWWVTELHVEGYMEGVEEGSRDAGRGFIWDD